MAFSQNSFVISPVLLYHLVSRDTRRLGNEALKPNPIVSSKQWVSGLKTTNCCVICSICRRSVLVVFLGVVLLFYYSAALLMLHHPVVFPLFRQCSVVLPVFQCSTGFPIFRQCSVVLPVFQCSASFRVFRQCSGVPPVFRVP